MPEEIKSSGKLIVGVNIPYTAQRVQGRERQDRRLRRRPDGRRRRHARADAGVPRGRLRQDHPVDPGRDATTSACRRSPTRKEREPPVDFVTYFSAGTSGRRRPGAGSIRTTPAARRSPCRRPPTEETDELPAKSKACTDAGKPAIEIMPFDGQDAATNAVVLGQADAMSADSPVTPYAIKQSDGKLEAGRRALRLRALRLAGEEGLAAGAVAAEGAASTSSRAATTRRSRRTGVSRTA